jgi:hypothetical protein
MLIFWLLFEKLGEFFLITCHPERCKQLQPDLVFAVVLIHFDKQDYSTTKVFFLYTLHSVVVYKIPWPHSQHVILSVPYECAEKARLFAPG